MIILKFLAWVLGPSCAGHQLESHGEVFLLNITTSVLSVLSLRQLASLPLTYGNFHLCWLSRHLTISHRWDPKAGYWPLHRLLVTWSQILVWPWAITMKPNLDRETKPSKVWLPSWSLHHVISIPHQAQIHWLLRHPQKTGRTANTLSLYGLTKVRGVAYYGRSFCGSCKRLVSTNWVSRTHLNELRAWWSRHQYSKGNISEMQGYFTLKISLRLTWKTNNLALVYLLTRNPIVAEPKIRNSSVDLFSNLIHFILSQFYFLTFI